MTNSEYWQEIAAIAKAITAEIKAGADPFETLYAAIDQHEFVIYTHTKTFKFYNTATTKMRILKILVSQMQRITAHSWRSSRLLPWRPTFSNTQSSSRTEFERAFDEHQVLNELKASSWESLSESCVEIPIGRKR